jgi:peptide/nickel transport system substrate-binding protein
MGSYWERLAGQQVNRRRVLRGAGIAGAGGAAFLAACSGSGDKAGETTSSIPATQAAQAPQSDQGQGIRGGVLNMPGSDGGIFDPAIAIHGGTASSVFAVYDFINYNDTGFKLTAAMAELPELVDQTTVVYKIKPNVFWHDKAPLNGRAFTAQDAAFGLQRFGQNNPEFVFRDRFAPVAKYETPDNNTLRLTLSAPFSPLLTAVAEESTLMVAREAVESFGDKAISSDFGKAIGTGPFMPVSREKDVETLFERNPKYYRTGLPYFDRFRVIWFADAALRQAAFTSGQTDFLNAHWTGNKQDIDAVVPQLGADKVVSVPNPVSFGSALHFNTKVKPYDDPRVRTALHLATDREQVLAQGQGNVVLGGPIPAAISPYGYSEDDLRKRPGYRQGKDREADLAEAKKLLAASGVDLRNLPKMQVWSSLSAVAQIMQQNWREIGFNVEIEELSTADALATRQSRKGFSIVMVGQQGAADPDLLYNDLHTKGGQNYGDFSNPEIDALLEKGRATFGVQERKKVYDEVQERLLKDLNPRVWFYWSLPTVTFRSYLKGFRPHPPITSGNIVIAGMWFDGKR